MTPQYVIPPNAKRAALDRCLQEMGINKNDFLINEATLRLEQALVAGKNTYEFNILSNPGSDRPLEQKLDRNDAFCVVAIGLGIAKQNTVASPKQYGNFPVFTYPDPNYFVGNPAAVSVNEDVSLMCLFNGKFTLKVDTVEVIQDFNTYNLRYNPQAGYDAGAGTVPEWPEFGPTMGGRGLYLIEPQAILNGQQNNSVIIELGDGDTGAIAGGVNAAGAAVDTTNVGIVFLHGFVFQNMALSAPRYGTF